MPELVYLNVEKNFVGTSFFEAIATHCHKLEQLFVDPMTQTIPEEFYTNCKKVAKIKKFVFQFFSQVENSSIAKFRLETVSIQYRRTLY